MLSFADDPYSYVMFTFPWNDPTGPLRSITGPREWQADALKKIGEHMQQNRSKSLAELIPEVLQMAFASGRGIGKSAFLAWVATWMFSCIPGSTTVVSANTEQQLKGTTFPEIRKWATMAINSNWYEHGAMYLRPAAWLAEALRKSTSMDDAYWYIQARLWSEENPDAFAGVHSMIGMAVLFDEASGIPSPIWPVTQGYFTDRTIHRLWIAISNPRNPSGEFFECFHKNRNHWMTKTIDARSVKENDQTLYNNIIEQYGEDSDQARVEVYGMFPRQGDNQFISRGEVRDAMEREVMTDPYAPLIMGVDPARFGDDEAVIRFRQGRDARVIEPQRYQRCDIAVLAEHCITAIEKYNPDGVCVEGDGVGGGLIDILKAAGYRITEVTMGGRAHDPDMYANRRTEVWGLMRDWIPSGALSNDGQLADDLGAPLYDFTPKGQLKLEPKDKMKKRGYASPNDGDALALTFGGNFARRDLKSGKARRPRFARGLDYSPI